MCEKLLTAHFNIINVNKVGLVILGNDVNVNKVGLVYLGNYPCINTLTLVNKQIKGIFFRIYFHMVSELGFSS